MTDDFETRCPSLLANCVALFYVVFDHDHVEPGEVAIGDCQKSHKQAVDKVGVEQDRGEEPLTGNCDD